MTTKLLATGLRGAKASKGPTQSPINLESDDDNDGNDAQEAPPQGAWDLYSAQVTQRPR